MLTVKELKKELLKFKDDDLCFAHEGSVVGIIINRGDKEGVIHCGGYSEKETKETKVI